MSIITLYHRDGHEKTFTADEISRMASCGQVGAGKDWSSVKPPPRDWEKTVPRYLVVRELRPSPNPRHKFESPFSEIWQSDIWQQADREYAAGEIVESTVWPHASMQPAGPIDDPAHYAASRVLEFFKAQMKSRMTTSPWHGDRIRLDNGLSNLPTPTAVRPPQVPPFNSRPAA
jgi:hypothetical protein